MVVLANGYPALRRERHEAFNRLNILNGEMRQLGTHLKKQHRGRARRENDHCGDEQKNV